MIGRNLVDAVRSHLDQFEQQVIVPKLRHPAR
jgi:hypothetical protein